MKQKYKGNENIDKAPTGMTPTGFSAKDGAIFQDTNQRANATSEKWLLAKMLNSSPNGKDSKPAIEKMGFEVLKVKDDLFYEVKQPEGWTKTTNHYWTTIYDDKGNERASQFFIRAPYGRCAFLKIEPLDEGKMK